MNDPSKEKSSVEEKIDASILELNKAIELVQEYEVQIDRVMNHTAKMAAIIQLQNANIAKLEERLDVVLIAFSNYLNGVRVTSQTTGSEDNFNIKFEIHHPLTPTYNLN